MNLETIPLPLDVANAFVKDHHRHSMPVAGHKFSIGAVLPGIEGLVGAAIVGRPVARYLDDGLTLEVTRVCARPLAPGAAAHPNVCSFLYGACRRAAFALGYRRLVTYTLKSESGASLRASGYRVVGEVAGRQWNTESRPRREIKSPQDKFRWEVVS